MALKVVDEALRQDFGFKNILWIYSGRRGIHCWVCDPVARNLPNEGRSAVVEYLSVHTTSSNGETAPSSGPIKKAHKAHYSNSHPMIKRAYDQLEPYFEKNICDGETGQGLLSTKDKTIKIINSIPNAHIKQELLTLLDSNKEKMSGSARWRQIKQYTTITAADITNNKRKFNDPGGSMLEVNKWREELILTYCYPRLDVNVSKAQNHLLKSPFCVHPKTGRVCIPIDPKNADHFNPFSTPTLRVLCAQVNIELFI